VNQHLILLLIYSAGLVALGLLVGRLVRSSGSFFVAGRGLSAVLVFATMLAANIGAGSTVGASSLGYQIGWGAWWWNGSAGLGTLVLAWWIGPRLWREASTRGFLTLGDYLEFRYSPAVRLVAALVLWSITVFVLAAQLIGVSSVLQVVAGQPRWVGAVVGGALMLTYFVAGGLLSSAWVNLVQLVVMMAGFLAAVPFAIGAAHGVPVTAGPGPSGAQSFVQGTFLVPLLVPAFIVSPGLVQKVYGAVDERAVRTGVGLSGLALMLFAFLPPLLGLCAHALHPGLPSADLALATVLVHDVPPAVGSLGLAAVFSAEVSSADAALFMLATSLSQDLYRRFLRPSASDAQVLLAARGAAVAGGVVGMALAVVVPTVVTALTAFYSLLTVLLFVPVIAAVALKDVGGADALLAMGSGVAVTVATQVTVGAAGWHGWGPAPLGLAASVSAFALSYLIRSRA
jgi:solute:Na+ symporter, SSS family